MTLNRKLVGITASVMAVATVAATWAFYSSTHNVDNKMSTGSYGDVLTEKFAPDSNWQPGDEADKIVGVTNTGDYDLVVRVKMDETWSNKKGELITITSDAKNFLTATAAEGGQVSATDGTVTGDGSVVAKTFLDENGWTLADDGYWYYTDVLSKDEATKSLLTAITLSEDADMGVYAETVYYVNSISETQPDFDVATWVVLGADEELADVVEDGKFLYVRSESNVTANTGYSSADYVLTITSETLQATSEAVETWDTAPEAVVAGWNLSA